MTVLYDPARRTIYTDEACFPLSFAEGDVLNINADRDGLVADNQTLVASIVALHHGEDGVCAEDALNWPCKTVLLAQASGAVL